MTIPAAAVLLADLALAYAGIGLVLGLAFLLVGIDRIDPAAKGAHAVRPLLLLWPLVAWRWAALERARRSAPGGG